MSNRDEISEKINQLEYALEKIYEAQTIIDEVVASTEHESHYEAYGRYGLDQLQGNGNPYDSSIYSIIDSLSEEL